MTIETERLLLRPLVMEDTDAVYAYSREPEVGPAAGWKPHENVAETEEIMKQIFVGQEGVFAIVDKETGVLMGTVGLLADPKRENDRARMLGYAMGAEYWGRGFMTEAARAVTEYGFRVQSLELIAVYCYPENVRSRRVIEKLGFQYEGRLSRCEVRFDGAVLDNLCFALPAPSDM